MSEPGNQACPFGHTLPSYPFKRDPAAPFDLPREVSWLRQEAPMCKVALWDGNEVWLATRMKDIRAILSDDRFSSVSQHDRYPTWSAAVKEQKTTNASFLRKDRPVHTQHRRLWVPFFSAGNIAALRPSIQRYVDEAIDAMVAAGQPADIVRSLGSIIPAAVISKLLAVPEEDRAFFQSVGAKRSGIDTDAAEVHKALDELHDYWLKRIDDRLASPGDDLVSRMVEEEVRTGRVSKDELASMAMLILLAGSGTTADMIAMGTLMILKHPQVAAKMKRDPSFTPKVIEELMRYTTIVQHGLGRVALQDVEIGGVEIRAGEGVVAHLASANRDEELLPEGDVFDPERQIRFHAAFGAGIHSCIGAPLARAELQIVFDTLLRRLPDLRLAIPAEQVRLRLDGIFFEVEELPVAW